MIQSDFAPIYPPDAKAAGVSGMVALKAVIGVDGRISDLRVISGPALLQQAAIDAVRLPLRERIPALSRVLANHH
ncbi:MAG: TonB family protein [Terracidiphilus sp.]